MATLSIKIYNQRGTIVGELELNPLIFGLKPNVSLLHQAIVAFLANQRKVLGHAKTRGEVRGGGKKPWRQKGTGRARHGSIRSPIWIGGGVVFGPTSEKNFSQKINKKMKRKALLMSLSDKVASGGLVILDKFDLPEAKTKKMAEIIKNLQSKLRKDFDKGLMIVLEGESLNVSRAVRNIPNVFVSRVENLNTNNILKYKYLFATSQAIEKIEKQFSRKV